MSHIDNSTVQSQNSSTIIALAGNPNAGKTTLFNALTGLRQKVANYSGVTVERKEGPWKVGETNVRLIDLPGLYSLDATSMDEQIAHDVLVGKVENLAQPSAIIAVVDATNLERNLYLVTQLLEYKIPLVIALTMIDEFEKQEHEIDFEKLSKMLGVPVVGITASSNRGIDELAETVANLLETKPEIKFELNGNSNESENAKIFARYNFISNAVQESVKHNDLEKHRFSEKIDKVLTHKFFGLVVLVAILLVVFQTIFSWAEMPMNLLESGFGAVGIWSKNKCRKDFCAI